MSGKRKQAPIGHEERAKIRRLSSAGASVDHLALFWEVDVAEVQQILADREGQEILHSDAGELDLVVKRLMKDPEELCCPLSHALMDDPVVAADGITYERCMIEECLARMPNKSPMTGLPMSTTVLNPIQQTKSLIISFKEETVKEIISVVPMLGSLQALQLLKRGEAFVRPRLPDSSTKRKLAGLLLLQLKLPDADCSNVAKEAVTLLVELQDEGSLHEAMLDMKESDLVVLVSTIDEDTVCKLQRAIVSCDGPCRWLVNKELACRLASRLSSEERLKSLWALIRASLDDERHSWAAAAACLLSSHMGRLEIDLGDLPSDVLKEAARFLDHQDAAIAFAREFFRYDLGISACEPWPQKPTASIFQELAHRLADEKSEEKLQLLVRAHDIDDSHAAIQETLAKQLHSHILHQSMSGSGMEGLFLKLTVQEGRDMSSDVVPKLMLEEGDLNQVSPLQLTLLAKELGKHDRRSDGARVAVFAARALASAGKARDAEDAFIQAFSLDHFNKEAAEGVMKATMSMRDRCQQLEESRKVMEQDGKELKEQCEQLAKRCTELKTKLQIPRLEIGSSLVWNLSGYDFTGFVKGQEQLSDKFQLPGGIKAWMALFPKGYAKSSEGKATLSLNVDKPAFVKWTMQSGSSGARTTEYDFSEAPVNADGTIRGQGWPNFMPISEANGCITLRILSVQLPGSTLSFA